MLSIVIVNYRTSHQIEKCLSSIEKHEPDYKNFEFIIVDNASGDMGLEKLKKQFPYIKLIMAEKNGGFAYGNNKGFDIAKGDILFMLNPDTYVEDDAISKLYKKISNDKTISLIGPQLLFPDGSNQSYFEPKSYLTLWRLFCEKLYLPRIFKRIKIFNSYLRTYMDYNKETEVEQIGGAALMFKKEVLFSIGKMDERYFMYFEESDWCYTAVRAGLKLLYYPKAKIIHEAGLISDGNWERSTRDYLTSFKYYFIKNFSVTHYFFAYLLYFFGTFLRAIGLFFAGSNRAKYYLYYLKYMLRLKK